MNYKEEYYKSLKSPKWFFKRKKILERDGHKCTVCGSTTNLVIHHQYYYSNRFTMAWEYPDDCLITVCEQCHHEFHSTCEVELRDIPKDIIIPSVYSDNFYPVKNKSKAKKKPVSFKEKNRNENTLSKGQKRRRKKAKWKAELQDSIALNRCKIEKMKAENLEKDKIKAKEKEKEKAKKKANKRLNAYNNFILTRI